MRKKIIISLIFLTTFILEAPLASAFSCGTLPNGAVASSAYEEAGLTGDGNWKYAYPNTESKCEYKCDANHIRSGSSCIVSECTTSSNCTGGKICEKNKCVDSGLETATPSTPTSPNPTSSITSTSKPTASITSVTPNSVSGTGTIGTAKTEITAVRWYKDTSGCGDEPRVHLPSCTGTLLSSSAPGAGNNGTWTTSFSFAGAVTKETKYSLEVQDSKGNWSSCVSSILAAGSGADPDSGFGTGIDTSKGDTFFNCLGSAPSGSDKPCPSDNSGSSKVQDYWTLVKTCNSDKVLAGCQYTNLGIENSTEEETAPDSRGPSCVVKDKEVVINSGESFTNTVTVTNADTLKWSCSSFECKDYECNFKSTTHTDSLVVFKGTINTDGKVESTITYNNSDSSIHSRYCTFYVLNSNNPSKINYCTSNVAVRPVTNPEENNSDGNGDDSAVIPVEEIVPAELCGSVLGTNTEATTGKLTGNFSTDLAGKDIENVSFCSPDKANSLVNPPTKYPAIGGETSWECSKIGEPTTKIICAIKIANDKVTVVTTNNSNPARDVYGKCGDAKGVYSSGTEKFKGPFCEIGRVELFDSGKYEFGTGQDWNLKGVTSFLKLKTGGLATKMKWTCVGGISTQGLTPDQMSKTCEAVWRTPGKCNANAVNTVYPYNTVKIPENTTLCDSGSPSSTSPVFQQGYEGGWYASWTCSGSGDNIGNTQCSATRGVDPNIPTY